MSQVEITSLSKWFGGRSGIRAVDSLNLSISKGEFLVLLGPSGCGKTTTLRCLAGLETPNEGSISLAGRRVFDAAAGVDLSPDKRNAGMVFQSYALWPHLTVRRNIEYPLRARGLRQGLSEDWALEMARLVECEQLLDRYPSQLSGGQQQRIAVARGLVARPDLVLFDEPLSNLDARLRDQVRSQIHELHSRLQFTAVFVTHDQTEALALGTRLAVMNRGSIEQLDTPKNVFERPATEYVANFMGMSNRLPFVQDNGQWVCGGETAAGRGLSRLPPVATVTARLRELDLRISAAAQGNSGAEVALPAKVVDVAYAGRHADVVAHVGGQRVIGTCPSSEAGQLAPGTDAIASFEVPAAAFYDASGARLDF